MDDLDYLELIDKAREYGSNKEWNKSIKYYEKAFKIKIEVDDLLDLALVYLENENGFTALTTINTVISYAPDDYRGHYYKGLYYEHLNDNDRALNSYFKALTLVNDFPELYFKIGRIYDEEKNDTTKATEYYMKTLSIDPKHFYANLNLGSIYESENSLEKALKHTLISYKTQNTQPMVCYNLGVIYGKLQNIELSKKYYLEELKTKEPYPYAYYNLGIIYKDERQYQKAIECYINALNKLRKDSSVWYNLGCVYVLMNNFEEAFNAFKCACLINEKIKEYMVEDEEIKDFINSTYYNKL